MAKKTASSTDALFAAVTHSRRDLRHLVGRAARTVTVMRVQWERGSPTVRWMDGDCEIVKEHPRPVRSAAYIPDPPSVVIVEELPNGRPSDQPARNAVVYELDGAERLRLAPPQPPEGRMDAGFDQCFHDTRGVVAVCWWHTDLIWAYADVSTGELGPLAPFR